MIPVNFLISLLIINSFISINNGVFVRVIHYDNITEQSDDQFNNECLKWHNYYRSIHDASPLSYDDKVIVNVNSFYILNNFYYKFSVSCTG